MARKKRNEMAAGAFVILAIGVAFGVVVWLGGAGIFQPARQVAMFFRNEAAGSTGLLEGSFVQLGDDQVGKVVDIRFDSKAGRTLYVAQIGRGDVKVHADGKAQVMAGLVGGARLVIVNRGTGAAPLADENNPVELFGGLDQTMSDLAAAAQKVGDIAEIVRKEADAGQRGTVLAKVHRVIDSLESAADSVARIAADLKSQTDLANDMALLKKVHVSMDNVAEIIQDAKPKIGRTLTAVEDAAQQISQYARKDVADLLADLRAANSEILKITRDFSTVSEQTKQLMLVNRDNIDELIDNMVQVSDNLKATSKDVRRSPWRLLHQPDQKELHSQNIYDAARSFANGAEQLDQAVAKMTNLAKASPQGIPVDDPTLEKVREHLEQTFEKFGKAEQALWRELNSQ